MKKAIIILAVVVITFAACRPHSTIVVSNDHSYLKIEYAGTIVFNDDNTAIMHISPGGYFKCKNNYDKLKVEPDASGHPIYQVNGRDAHTTLDRSGEALMIQAAREVAKLRKRSRS
jgi:hypothetical protein